MDEEEHMYERNRTRRSKKHSRVRKIEEEYSGDESNCELSEILMLLRTPQKQPEKGRVAQPVLDQPSCREHNQTSMTFLAGSWSDSPTGSRLQLGLSVRISISSRVRFPHGLY